ncbi:MAG: arsenite methyltransferase [Promethearchaeota archaeon]
MCRKYYNLKIGDLELVKKEDIKKIRKKVKDRYNKIAKSLPTQTCNEISNDNRNSANTTRRVSSVIGYSEQELDSVPESSNMGLGCGNPVALASLKEGETVLDLGSGAGFDCFLAAKKVGKTGFVIGIDISPEMLKKARKIALEENYENVEFREGTIENLPVDDNSINLIISNCVVNLSPDKIKVYQEAFRVLKPGGRIMISDIVLLKKLPDFVQGKFEAYTGSGAGAMLKEEYLKVIQNAGFSHVTIVDQQPLPVDFFQFNPAVMELVNEINLPVDQINKLASSLLSSVKIKAFKPK